MKAIFLDIDGVLKTLTSQYFGDINEIDGDLVARLGRIVERTGAVIVLSSSWRFGEKSIKIVEQALEQHQLNLYGSTPKVIKGHKMSDFVSGENVVRRIDVHIPAGGQHALAIRRERYRRNRGWRPNAKGLA